MDFKLKLPAAVVLDSRRETPVSECDIELEVENKKELEKEEHVDILCLSEDGYISSESSVWGSSEEYDTDLEDADAGNAEKEKDDPLGLDIYQRICEQQKTFPQKNILHSLTQSSVHLTHRSLGPNNIRPLAAALIKNIRVETLNLQGNDLGVEGATYIAELLAHNFDLSWVDLSNCNIGDIGGMVLGDMLYLNKGLLALNLSGNRLGDKSGRSLASGLQANHTLIDLNLSHNNLQEAGAALFGQALGINEGLQRLDLSWNKIRKASAVAVCKGLKMNDTLTELNLSWNGFGYEGALGLSEMLKLNSTLKTLDVSSNRITWQGALLISQGLQINDTLEILKLGGNPLTTTGCMDLVEAVAHKGCALTRLDIKGVPVLAEFQMMAMAVQQTREFEFVHGGIVNSHDILGQRFDRRVEPMQRVIEYMKEREIRPTELFRSFDKSVANQLPREEMVLRLKKSGIPLMKHEIIELLDQIEAQAEEGQSLDYKSVKHSVQEQVERERRRTILEREKTIRLKKYHKRILNPKLPPLLEHELTDLGTFDFSQIQSEPEFMLSRSMSRATLPGIGLSGSRGQPAIDHMTRSATQLSLLNSTAPCMSMSRPLGSKVRAFGTGAPKKKKKKKKKGKSKKKK